MGRLLAALRLLLTDNGVASAADDSVPFLFSEPGVPELLTDGEDNDYGFDDEDFAPPAPPVDEQQTQRAFEKLRQIKLEHANCTIERPDDWLVFDPEQEALVLQKTKLARVSPSNGSVNGVLNANGAKNASMNGKGDELNPPVALGDAGKCPLSSPVPSAGKKQASERKKNAKLVPNGNGSVRNRLSSPKSHLATHAH